MAMTQNEAIDELTQVVDKQREDISINKTFISDLDDKLDDDVLLRIGNRLAAGEGAGVDQEIGAVAVGFDAGNSGQLQGGIALGNRAGYENQGINAIAIGASAAEASQPTNSIAIGYQSKTENEGDIVIETSNTLSGNDNKLEIKAGVVYINGIPLSILKEKTWNKIDDFWTATNSKYDNIDLRISISSKIYSLTKIEKNVSFTFGGDNIEKKDMVLNFSTPDRIEVFDDGVSGTPIAIDATNYIQARIVA